MEFQHFLLSNHLSQMTDPLLREKWSKIRCEADESERNVVRDHKLGVYVCLKVRNFYNWKPNLL